MSQFNDVSASPLSWPTGWPRCDSTDRWPGGEHTVHRGTRAVLDELGRLGVWKDQVVISTNLRLRLDGLPYSSQRDPEDRGVAVYFRLDGDDRVLACDRWDSIGCNLWAIAKHIQALRGMERWGVGSIEQAFRGYAALPSGEAAAQSWGEVLGFDPGQTITAADVRARHRKLSLKYHPDTVGGDAEAMSRINQAKDAALAEIGRA